MPNPLVSVIITNYNGRKYLGPCFDSLINGDYRNFEIVFVDNGSQDDSVEFVRNNYSQIKLIENKKNLGLAVASNRGREAALGEFLFFLNNDTISDKSLLSVLVKRAVESPRAGVLACKNMTYDGKQEVSLGLSCDVFGFPFENLGPVFYADAGIFIRSKVFDEIKGFDPKLFLYGEDRDLCWRVMLQGFDVQAVPEAVFFHDSFCTRMNKGGYTSTIRKRKLGEYAMLRSMLKNYGLHSLLLILPVYIFLSVGEMIFLIFNGQARTVYLAYLTAYWQNLLDFPDTLRRRFFVQRARKVPDSFILKNMVKASGKFSIFRKVGLPKFN